VGERKSGESGGLWELVCNHYCARTTADTAAGNEATGGQKIECLCNPGRGKGA